MAIQHSFVWILPVCLLHSLGAFCTGLFYQFHLHINIKSWVLYWYTKQRGCQIIKHDFINIYFMLTLQLNVNDPKRWCFGAATLTYSVFYWIVCSFCLSDVTQHRPFTTIHWKPFFITWPDRFWAVDRPVESGLGLARLQYHNIVKHNWLWQSLFLDFCGQAQNFWKLWLFISCQGRWDTCFNPLISKWMHICRFTKTWEGQYKKNLRASLLKLMQNVWALKKWVSKDQLAPRPP